MKITKLNINENKFRDLYLRKLALGELYGPLTNIPNIDKEWLKYYSEEQILADMPEKTIYEYMMEKNRDHLDDIALIYFGKTTTYRELNKKIDQCTKSLLAYGVKENDVVTLCMPNTPEVLIMFYALNKIGAVANMVHPLSSENEIRDFANEVNSKLIMTIDSSYKKVANISNETSIENIIVVSPKDSMPFPLKNLYNFTKNKCKIVKNSKTIDFANFMNKGNYIDKVDNLPYVPNKDAVILHTGGTTGKPKGVRLTNDNFNCMVEQFILNADNFARGDRMLTIMPVFHGFGLCSSIHLPLSQGVAAILVPKLDIANIDKMLIKYRPNHILGVPTLFKGIMSVIDKKIESGKLKKFDLSFLKYAVSGGDTVKENFETDVNRFFSRYGSNAKLAKGYGLSEAVAGATFAYNGYNNPSSVGIPMIKTNIKIVEPGTDKELHNNQDGEICIKGPTVMQGYYDNPEETKKTLIDGWFHTGDMGHFDKGILYFSQRKGNMIISSGVNVYPKEIEEVIESHPAVSSCAVIGIYHSYKNEVPKAYIVLKDGYELTDSIKSEIQDLCKKNLNKYSIPTTYEYCTNLPQTLLGKICHSKLREQEEQLKNNNEHNKVKVKVK